MSRISDIPDGDAAGAGALEQEVAAVYEAHAGGLFHYAVTLLHQAEDAQDALQEVFLRYFLERSCGGHVDSPRAWLYRVLRNYMLDWLEKASRKHEVSGSDADRFPARAADPEVLLHGAEVAAQIRLALTDRELNCLLLRAEGLSYLEIADVLNLQSGTVGAYLARVQRKLRVAAEDDRKFQEGVAQGITFLCHESQAW